MRTAPALLICLVATLALTGCVPDDGPIVVDPEPSSSASPIFESDEEALAAAEEAYGAYLAVSDAILNDGGTDAERLLSVASQELYEQALVGFSSIAEKGWHGSGSTAFDSAILQSYYADSPPGEQAVAIYVCVDLSNVDVVDASGASVVSNSRVDRSPYEVGFTTQKGDDSKLVVSSDEPWDGENFCDD